MCIDWATFQACVEHGHPGNPGAKTDEKAIDKRIWGLASAIQDVIAASVPQGSTPVCYCR